MCSDSCTIIMQESLHNLLENHVTPRIYQHPDTEEISLPRVLAALSDPTRLEMIRRLADGQEHDSLELADNLPRSTLTRGGSHMVPERGSKLSDRTAERRPGCTFPRSDTSRCREHLNPSRAVMIGKLWPFALGSVALGLDAYVIAGLLPAIAWSLKASESSV